MDKEMEKDKEYEEDDEELERMNVSIVSKFEALDEVDAAHQGKDITSELDHIRRQNIALLRMPFSILVDNRLRWWVLVLSWSIFGIFLVMELALIKNYTVEQFFQPFGEYTNRISFSSVLFFFLAVGCDAREIYIACKETFATRDPWLPMITVDLSDEMRCLFIGNNIVPIDDITEFHSFPKSFIQWCIGGTVCEQVVVTPNYFMSSPVKGYAIGMFPWCLFAMLLREAYLDFASMRVVTPTVPIPLLFLLLLFVTICVRAAGVHHDHSRGARSWLRREDGLRVALYL